MINLKLSKISKNFASLIINFCLKFKTFEKIAILAILNKDLHPNIFVKTPSSALRKFLKLPYLKYESQLNQDIFALIINKFKPGFFIEIGANDGFTLSNTIYLEKKFAWRGILVEANPKYLQKLNLRKSIIVNKAITDFNGKFEFIDAGLYGGLQNQIDTTHQDKTRDANIIKVKGYTLHDMLIDCRAPKIINFISIDTEGGDLSILIQLCKLKNYRFICGCIEHNSRERERKFKSILNQAGYEVVWSGKTGHDLFFMEKGYQFIV